MQREGGGRGRWHGLLSLEKLNRQLHETSSTFVDPIHRQGAGASMPVNSKTKRSHIELSNYFIHLQTLLYRWRVRYIISSATASPLRAACASMTMSHTRIAYLSMMMASPHHPNNRRPGKSSNTSASGAKTSSSASSMASPASNISSRHTQPPSHAHHHHHSVFSEDRLAKTWRTLANCFIAGTQKAEKLVRNTDGTSATVQQSPQVATLTKELHDYVALFLRQRVEWGRLISHLEAKLEGTAQEMETIQQFHRTVPVLRRGEVQPNLRRVSGQPTTTTTLKMEGTASRKRKEVDESALMDDGSGSSEPKKVARTT